MFTSKEVPATEFLDLALGFALMGLQTWDVFLHTVMLTAYDICVKDFEKLF